MYHVLYLNIYATKVNLNVFYMNVPLYTGASNTYFPKWWMNIEEELALDVPTSMLSKVSLIPPASN